MLLSKKKNLQFVISIEITSASMTAGQILTGENLTVIADHSFQDIIREGKKFDVLLIPGGRGTRSLVNDGVFLSQIKELSKNCTYVITVCTGAALLAKTGLLDNLPATTNRIAWDWATQQGPHVRWDKTKRWVDAGKIWTSAGVSAGIDMALAFLTSTEGEAVAQAAAKVMEYKWDPNCGSE